MTARVETTVGIHDFPAVHGCWETTGVRRWLSLTTPGGRIALWGPSHAAIAATLIRLAGEAMGHMDSAGRAEVLAAVHEAFTPPEALDPGRALAEVSE